MRTKLTQPTKTVATQLGAQQLRGVRALAAAIDAVKPKLGPAVRQLIDWGMEHEDFCQRVGHDTSPGPSVAGCNHSESRQDSQEKSSDDE